jgi:N-acetylated-alpha-linked acidic dipeptidase
VRELTRDVDSPLGGSVYQQWRTQSAGEGSKRRSNAPPQPGEEIHVGDLGSGSDYSAFFQHAGVPSTDISSDGPYGVYHSVFDNYAWFVQNADPHFTFLQEMARVLGLEALRMADAEVLPYDYVSYAHEIQAYLNKARDKAAEAEIHGLDFAPAAAAAERLSAAASRVYTLQTASGGWDATVRNRLNLALRQTESALLTPAGLPHRPWFRHSIYAPGEYTGYAAVVLPGVTEAIDAKDAQRAAEQLNLLTQALDRATHTLDSAQ